MNTITLDDLLGSLTTHELTLNSRKFEDDTNKKNKIILKSGLQEESDEDDSSSDDEDMNLVKKKFKNLMN